MEPVTAITSTSLRKDLGPTLDEVRTHKTVKLIKRRSEVDWALIDTDYLEELLELHDPQYLKSIAEARKQAQKGQVYTLDEAFAGL